MNFVSLVYNHVCKARVNKEFYCMLFCDISKAVDESGTSGLLYKLKCHVNDELADEWLIR